MKGKTRVKRQAKAEKADLLDWLLAIDVCLTWQNSWRLEAKRRELKDPVKTILREGLYLQS